ncbi:HlyD family secretion protein [soil metagenome]
MPAVEPLKAETRMDSNVVELPVTAPPRRSRRKLIRGSLLILGPLAAIGIGTSMYLAGGRYVETDNAYVRAPIMNVMSDVSGIVKTVAVGENQHVNKGDLIFKLDDEPFRIALAGAEAQKGMVRNELLALQATYRQMQSEIQQQRTAVTYAQTALEHQLSLQKTGVASRATLDEPQRDLDTAREKLLGAQRQADAILSQLGGDADAPIEQHPRMLDAQSNIDKARRDLNHAEVHAPWSGTAANVENLRPGTYLSLGQAALSLVATDDLWVEANPKETDLTYLKVGDKATVTVDAYPGKTWTATVTSVAPATGSEFSVLPPQNASGNWVKVVQRVPVRLTIDDTGKAPALRTGMSVDVSIDTGHKRDLGSLMGAFAKESE